MALATVNPTSWMAGLPDRTRLVDLLLPGTHDTATFGNDWWDGAGYVQTQQNQSHFSAQLDGGIRAWDLRLKKVSDDPAKLGDNLAIFHGSYYTNTSLNQALSAAKAFLEANPTETLLICLKQEGDGLAENAKQSINADDIDAYLKKYAINATTKSNLWVAGISDFQAIAQQRESKGLSDLNRNPTFILNTSSNPREEFRQTGTVNKRLNYDALTLGDLRGKCVLMVRDFSDYDGTNSGSSATATSWKNSDVAGIDLGTFSSGLWAQDNYNYPGYQEKRNDIFRALKGEGASSWGGAALNPGNVVVNFSSATGIVGFRTPARYAVNINSGPAAVNYKNDGEPSLTTALLATGDITAWNAAQKRQNKPGVRGALLGDYVQAPQSWYEQYNKQIAGVPDPNNTSDYDLSGQLPRLIFNQNAFIGIRLSAPIDSITGLPTFREGASGQFTFLSYMGNPDGLGLNAKITRVDGKTAGVSPSTLQQILIAKDADSIIAWNKKVHRSSSAKTYTVGQPFTLLAPFSGSIAANNGVLNFTIAADSTTQGYRFYQLDLMTPSTNQPVAASTFFAVTDV